MKLLPFALALAVTACSRTSPTASTQNSPPPPVATTIARAGSIRPSETLSGLIAPLANVSILSTFAEPAISVRVREGDEVAQEEVLALLDTRDLEANLQSALRNAAQNEARVRQTLLQGSLNISQTGEQLANARSALLSAREKLRLDILTLNRDRQLLPQGFIAQAQYDSQATTVRSDEATVRSDEAALRTAEDAVRVNGSSPQSGLQGANLAAARAAAAAARAQAEQIRAQISHATIRSPIDGVVVNRYLNPGEYPGSRQLFVLQATSRVFAILNASTEQVLKVPVGTRVDVRRHTADAPSLRGTVAAVLNQSVPGTTAFVVKVLVPNRATELRPGMVVSGDVALPAVHGVIVPTTAFLDDTHGSVLVVRNGTAVTARVRELSDAGGDSVVQGLPSGSRVVVNGQAGITPGEQVVSR